MPDKEVPQLGWAFAPRDNGNVVNVVLPLCISMDGGDDNRAMWRQVQQMAKSKSESRCYLMLFFVIVGHHNCPSLTT